MPDPSPRRSFGSGSPPPLRNPLIRDRVESLALTLANLRHAAHTYDRYETQYLAQYDLTPAQFGVLQALAHDLPPGPISLGQLAQHLRISPGTLTGLIKRLNQKHWIQRSTAPGDRRTTLIHLSPQGLQQYQHISLRYQQHRQDDLNGLDRAELDLLRVLLHKLDQQLHQALPPSSS